LELPPAPLGQDAAGRDRVHGDPGASQLMSHAPGELEDSSLRRAVREASEARIAPVAAGIRGDIDDAPPLLAPHGRRHFPAAQELALQVEIHYGIPLFVAR